MKASELTPPMTSLSPLARAIRAEAGHKWW